MVPISVRVSEELNERLLRLSKKTGRPKNFYIRQALEDYIEDMEDLYLGFEALKREEKVYTFEEAKDIILRNDKMES